MRKLKIEIDGNDSLSIEHKEEIHIFQRPANKQHTYQLRPRRKRFEMLNKGK